MFTNKIQVLYMLFGISASNTFKYFDLCAFGCISHGFVNNGTHVLKVCITSENKSKYMCI